MEKSEWQSLGAPYVFANSDLGLVVGMGGGISRYSDTYALLFFSISTRQVIEGGVSAIELIRGGRKYIGNGFISQAPRYIYTLHDNDPQEVASATMLAQELQVASLKLNGNFEIGPSLLLRSVDSKDAEDADDNPISDDLYPRFRKGSLALIGLRMRYFTTSPIRPMNGWIMDSGVRIGFSSGDDAEGRQLDGDFELRLAYVKPVNELSRIYFRAWSIMQLNAPPPVQQILGWERNHRGQPFMREWGRRFLSGRIQYHITILKKSRLPMYQLNRWFKFIKAELLDYEIVPFYDIGAIGDPVGGWHKTRHGIGLGLHVVMPPELVLRLDFAVAPNGPLRFFIGAGETI